MDDMLFETCYQVLLLQAADEGRAEALFGNSLLRARAAVPPFLVGKPFPDVYFEHPLLGDPYLDVTLLLFGLEPGTRVDSGAAGDHAAMLDWVANARRSCGDIGFGFELDTKEEVPPVAAVHFQPRWHTELVRPFCRAAGEPERAGLYLDLASRMPQGWELAYLGLFRGRPESPLRACGYMGFDELRACSRDSSRLAEVFDKIGFGAYDAAMLRQVSLLLATAPGVADFQFDICPDGRLGPTFAMEVQFGIEQPSAVRKSFESGAGARVMGLLEGWGAADDRWRSAVGSAFACAIPAAAVGGGTGELGLTLMPQWAKARWVDGVLQPAKLYHLARADLLEGGEART